MRSLEARELPSSRPQGLEIQQAINALPWVGQLCPLMRHQYATLDRSPAWAWYALDAMIRQSRYSYLAYFRGYQRPTRYWDGPDGLRYWRIRFELNRCTLNSVEPPRRVDEAGTPMTDWDGPPWAPRGSGLYVRSEDGRWWPTEQALANGYQPCVACKRRGRTARESSRLKRQGKGTRP